jgi:hypothetical protein
MTLSLEAQHQTCRRQLERLRAPDLERHDLLDVATALMLLVGSVDPDDGDDVSGHDQQGRHGINPDIEAQADLTWIRSHGRTGSLDELRRRTRRAARELCSQLSENPNSRAID